MREVQNAMKSDTVSYTKRYFVSLPDVDAHSNHSCGGAAGFAQTVHPAIIHEISNIVRNGITKATEVKAALRRFVKTGLNVDQGIKPEETNRAYYPSGVDIKNNIYLAKQKLKLSKLDQENLSLSIIQWQIESPGTKYHFRPYRNVKGPLNTATSCTGTPNNESVSLSKNNFSKSCKPRPDAPITFSSTASQSQQHMLYVHQEKWQQDLLVRYGNTISLIDATYKTTKYDLALFFICVKTNVNYTVVADIVIQHETAEQIAEALQILKDWNPVWKPQFWMTDYSEAQMTGLTTSFPESTLYLCDFHREQAWTRWVRDLKHGLNTTESESLLEILRKMAYAPPCQEPDKAIDYFYRKEEENLKKSGVRRCHDQVNQWLSRKWLCIPDVRL